MNLARIKHVLDELAFFSAEDMASAGERYRKMVAEALLIRAEIQNPEPNFWVRVRLSDGFVRGTSTKPPTEGDIGFAQACGDELIPAVYLRPPAYQVEAAKRTAAFDAAGRPWWWSKRCCDEARNAREACVCSFVTFCPTHGTKHHGTHD